MLLHILHAEVDPRRAALYDATARDEAVLRAWRAGGVAVAVPLVRGHARGLLTFWPDAACCAAWQSGPGCAAVRRVLSRFAVDGIEPGELTFELATSGDTFGTAERGMGHDPNPSPIPTSLIPIRKRPASL